MDIHNVAAHYINALNAQHKIKKAGRAADKFRFFEPGSSWEHTTLAITARFYVDKYDAISLWEEEKGARKTYLLTLFHNWYCNLCRHEQRRYENCTSIDTFVKCRAAPLANDTETKLIDLIEDTRMTNRAEMITSINNFISKLDDNELTIVSARLKGEEQAATAAKLGISVRTLNYQFKLLKTKAKDELL